MDEICLPCSTTAVAEVVSVHTIHAAVVGSECHVNVILVWGGASIDVLEVICTTLHHFKDVLLKNLGSVVSLFCALSLHPLLVAICSHNKGNTKRALAGGRLWNALHTLETSSSPAWLGQPMACIRPGVFCPSPALFVLILPCDSCMMMDRITRLSTPVLLDTC